MDGADEVRTTEQAGAGEDAGGGAPGGAEIEAVVSFPLSGVVRIAVRRNPLGAFHAVAKCYSDFNTTPITTCENVAFCYPLFRTGVRLLISSQLMKPSRQPSILKAHQVLEEGELG